MRHAYILDVGGKRYFVACTVMQEDDSKYDKVFETLVSSMMPADKL